MTKRRQASTGDDWLPTAVWFVAAIPAQGLWYFPTTGNWLGFAISVCLTASIAAIAVSLQRRPSIQHDRSSLRDGVSYLLRLMWAYPLQGAQERSWASKESAALNDELGVARERPGLGVAIVTTELALLAFGANASNRFDGVVSWTLQRCEREPPFRVVAELQDPICSATLEIKPDLRHTMAFGIILLRLGREHRRSAGYLGLALSQQEADGGWPPGSPTTDTAVFATLYGIELIGLAYLNPLLPRETRRQLPQSRRRAIAWLIGNRTDSGLWSTGVFQDRTWDCAVGTAWVLHRQLRAPMSLRNEWQACVERATGELARLCEDTRTWSGVSSNLRFRIEARVVGAMRRALQYGSLSDPVREVARRYVGAWNATASTRLAETDEGQIDIGTAAFAIWAMAEEEQIKRLGRLIVRE